jgi:hypothetical protein
MTALVITALHRDLAKGRSFVTVTWKDDPEKRLGLPVPFNCSQEELKAEAEKAVRALSEELKTATVEEL